MTPVQDSSIDVLGCKILIVDDRPINILLLERVLVGAGYTAVMSTTNPCQVAALHLQHAYDLILLDMQMPEMDGYKVMAELKQIEPQGYLPVLAITANPDHKLRALQAGARDFISKPLDIAETLMRVRNLLQVRLLNVQLQAYGKRLELLALHDPLTGLANRRLLDDRLAVAISHAHRQQGVMAVLYLDLDGFKNINDEGGHAFGDALLRAVALRLLKTVREEDTVCRLGGDEFVIVLNHIGNIEYAAKAARKVIDAVLKPFEIQANTICITASVGLSCYPLHGLDASTLLKAADAALYEAKREGKNTYRVSA